MQGGVGPLDFEFASLRIGGRRPPEGGTPNGAVRAVIFSLRWGSTLCGFRRCGRSMDAFAGDLDEVADASGGGGLVDELRVRDFAALGLADGGFDLDGGEFGGDGSLRVGHWHDA